MAYSAGFNPHPKISYANAAATGHASEAEYVEIGLASAVVPDKLVSAFGLAMPRGLDVIEAVEAITPDFMERFEASIWRVGLVEVDESVLAKAVETFKGTSEVLVSRMTKNGLRTFDARGPVIDMSVEGSELTESGRPCAILRLVVRHVTPSVRPDDVLTAVSQVADLEFGVAPRITRIAQGPLTEAGNQVGDPLDLDRNIITD
jgi:radical SAM-linked protein